MELTLISTEQEMPLSAVIDAARAAEEAGAWGDALEGYANALERVRAGEQPERGPELYRWMGRLNYERGQYDEAHRFLEAGLVMAQTLGRRQDAARLLNSMASVEQLRGRLDVSEALYSRAAALADMEDMQLLSAMIEQNLGTLANIRGDLGTALMRYQAALDRYRALENDRAAGWVLVNMGMLRTQVGEWAAAELSFNAAAQLAEKTGDAATIAKVEINRAQLYLKRQNFERARECCERAFKGYSELGAEKGLGEAHKTFGVLYRDTGKPQVAHVQLGLALKLARSCENLLLEAETENERALLLLAERNVTQALHSLNRAHKLFCELDARREILDLRRRLDALESTYMLAAQMWGDDTPTSAPHIALATGKASRGKRVAELASMLANACGYNELIWLRIGAYLHDVGNRSLPADLLDKPGPLTAEEFDIVRNHTIAGDTLIRQLEFPEDIRPMVRSHHEHWDGTGYPDGLDGEAIPLSARIICIADVYDALTSARSYRQAFSNEEALRIMETEAGKIFDPHLFGLFARLLRFGGVRETSHEQDYKAAI